MPASNVQWAPPLTRLNPWFPGQFGVHGAWTETGLRQDTTGAIFWVNPNSTYAEDAQDGTDPNYPLATVERALALCQAYRNDVIIVSPNAGWQYADTRVGYTTRINEEVVVSVPGVRIVGQFPASPLGVVWDPVTDSGVCITVRAIDVLIEGFCFSNESGVTTPIGILAEWNGGATALYGDNLTVRHCYFANGMEDGILLDYAWCSDIHSNYFSDCTGDAIGNPSVYGDPDYSLIHDNLFMNNNAAIHLNATARCMIYRNQIYGTATGTDNFIDLTGGNTNLISDNWLGCALAGNQYNTTCSDSTSGSWVRNHCIDGETGAAPT